MSRSLPATPSLEALKKQAKLLLKDHKGGNAACCAVLRLLHAFRDKPDADILAAKISLANAQFALAMDYGFKDWKALSLHVQSHQEQKKPSESSSAPTVAGAETEQIDAMLVENGMAPPPDASDPTTLVPRRALLRIIVDALRAGSSDIHLEPMKTEIKVRCRVSGVLYEMPPLPSALGENVTAELMRIAKLDAERRNVPQDGRIMLTIDQRTIDLRVNVMPGIHGSVVALRILDRTAVVLSLERMDIEPEQLQRYRRLINSPQGIVIVTGPTGTGKTTTLYATLLELNTVGRKIMTVEDPVEYEIDGIDQIRLNTAAGMGFSQALRSVLRQAPNIIMAGEVRDSETAQILVQAALTGHLAFTTMHTDDAPGVLIRLQDLGLAPFLVRDTVKCVVAQRLLRRVCASCRAEYQPDAAELDRLALKGEDRNRLFYRSRGCEKCNRTGYSGRILLFSLLEMDEGVGKALMQADRRAIASAAASNGWRSLRELALQKALTGDTTVEEVLRFT